MTVDTGAVEPSPNQLFCFGFGYTAAALAQRLTGSPTTVVGTRRRLDQLRSAPVQLAAFDGTVHSAQVATLLPNTTHVLLSVPPGPDGDPVLLCHGKNLADLKTLQWIGYLSTIGVYGDTGGEWVDETSPVRPQSDRARRRADAEAGWRAFGAAYGKRVEIFRLPGIYGPGRSAIDTLKSGTARRIVKPGQVFNRAHVTDIAAALASAMAFASAGKSHGFDTFNVVDDEPAPPQDVVAFAAGLLGLPSPPEQAWDAAHLSPMAQSFYGENKRVSNHRLQNTFDCTLTYPTYREGLRAIASAS